MSDMSKLAQQVADRLRGSCESLTNTLENMDAQGADDNAEFCAALDSLVFQCDCCEWWCDISEMVGDRQCSDCDEYFTRSDVLLPIDPNPAAGQIP